MQGKQNVKLADDATNITYWRQSNNAEQSHHLKQHAQHYTTQMQDRTRMKRNLPVLSNIRFYHW